MRVVVLHNRVRRKASAAERDVLVQVEAVSEAVRLAGHDVLTLPVWLDLSELRLELEDVRPDVAFNLVESLGGSDRLAVLATTVLDVLGCPYTGSPTRAIFLLSDKLEEKRHLRDAGVPTPDWVSPADGSWQGADPVSGPPDRYILKPVYEHASCGIEAASVVEARGLRQLRAELSRREQQLGKPCFAERYVDGREFNLSVLAGPRGPEVLPPAEILFDGLPGDRPRIVDYRAKWEPDSPEYCGTPRTFDFPASDGPLLAELARQARSCWHLFGLHGYARVDFRVDAEGRPWVLEVNANPCLSPDAGFAAAVDRAGTAFPQAIQRVLDDAVRPRVVPRPAGTVPPPIHPIGTQLSGGTPVKSEV